MKVLIVSYNPLTLYNNGGKYMLSLFSEFKEKEMCQLYVHDVLPDQMRCHSYYRITDKDVMNAFFGKSGQHELRRGEIGTFLSESRKAVIGEGANRYAKLMVRDFLWRISPWRADVYRWIEREHPDCIFADTGDSCFLYSISMGIAKKYGIPMIASFGDDYYGIDLTGASLIKKIQISCLRSKIKKFVNKCDKVITINDLFSQYYSDTFHIPLGDKVITLANGSNYNFDTSKEKIEDPTSLKFSYLGNLSLGRWQNLLEIGRALDDINQRYHSTHCLQVYAKNYMSFDEKSREIASIRYMGFVGGDDFTSAIMHSDILIHTESFLPEYIEQTRLSLSTKIADSVNAGKCILAYGPADIASMHHLQENKCAHVVTEPDKLEYELEVLLANQLMRRMYIVQATHCAQRYHNSRKNSQRLRSVLKMLLKIE